MVYFLDMYNFNEQSAETENAQKKPAGEISDKDISDFIDKMPEFKSKSKERGSLQFPLFFCPQTPQKITRFRVRFLAFFALSLYN